MVKPGVAVIPKQISVQPKDFASHVTSFHPSECFIQSRKVTLHRNLFMNLFQIVLFSNKRLELRYQVVQFEGNLPTHLGILQPSCLVPKCNFCAAKCHFPDWTTSQTEDQEKIVLKCYVQNFKKITDSIFSNFSSYQLLDRFYCVIIKLSGHCCKNKLIVTSLHLGNSFLKHQILI